MMRRIISVSLISIGITLAAQATDLIRLKQTTGIAGLTGLLSTLNVVVGDSTTKGVQDSGKQIIKTGVFGGDPTNTDDNTQSYSIASPFFNTVNHTIWFAGSVATNAAQWYQAVTLRPFVSKGWVALTTLAGATNYTATGGTGTTQNFENPVSYNVTINNLNFNAGAFPGTGQTYTITLMAGTPGAMTATAVTCTISGAGSGISNCKDTTHTAALTAYQAYAVRVVASGGAAGTQTSSVSVGENY